MTIQLDKYWEFKSSDHHTFFNIIKSLMSCVSDQELCFIGAKYIYIKTAAHKELTKS